MNIQHIFLRFGILIVEIGLSPRVTEYGSFEQGASLVHGTSTAQLRSTQERDLEGYKPKHPQGCRAKDSNLAPDDGKLNERKEVEQMKTRINKKNETVTLTVNAEELWAIRNGLFCAWEEHLNTCSTLADEAMKIRDKTDKAFMYLAREW